MPFVSLMYIKYQLLGNHDDYRVVLTVPFYLYQQKFLYSFLVPRLNARILTLYHTYPTRIHYKDDHMYCLCSMARHTMCKIVESAQSFNRYSPRATALNRFNSH